jgi:uncharacterized membrane protein
LIARQAKQDCELKLKAEPEIMQLHDKLNELGDSSWADPERMQQRKRRSRLSSKTAVCST